MQPQMPTMAQGQFDRLNKISQSPLYRFGSALAGTDPIAAQLLQQQQMIQQQQQFMTTKQLAVGAMLLQYVEKISTIQQPELRNAVAQTGKEFLGPLLKEIGFNASPSLFAGLMQAPGTSTMLGQLISSRFGNDPAKINELTSYLSNFAPKDVAAEIKRLYDMDVEAAIPTQMTNITGLMNAVRKNPSVMQQLGGIDKEGKNIPINISSLEEHFLNAAKNPAEKEAVMRILSDPKYAGFLAQRGLQTGASAESAQKVQSDIMAKLETPLGKAELEKTQAEVPLVKAQTAAAETPVITPIQNAGGIATTAKGKGNKPEIAMAPEVPTAQISKMREEFNTQSKNFITVRDFYNQIPSAVKNPSAAGDIGLVFSFMKILDPTSTVRESEYATASNAAGVPDRIRNQWNKLMEGERLTVNQRQDFETQAGRVMKSRIDTHAALEKQYRELAERNKLNPADVVVDYMGPLRTLNPGTPGLMPPAKRVTP